MKEEDRRPDSEQLLRSIQNADGPPGGRLKIFFGYAAGVGKTYAMLEAAHRAKEAGVDVVAGYIEPHTRPETMALLEGYPGLYCVESFDPRVVRWFKRHHPGIIRGQLMCYKPQEDMPGWMAFIGRNLLTNFLTRPHFEAYDFTTRHNASLRAARRVYGMQEVSWTLRSYEDYKAAKEDIHVISLWNFAVAHKDLPEDLVYDMTKATFEVLPQLANAVKDMAKTKPEDILYSSVPLHKGAIKYYREIGLTIPDKLIPAEAK